MASKPRPGNNTQKLCYAGLYLALAVALPFLTGRIPQIGAMLSPMHIPVLLCGFVCGWPWGLAVGAAAPILSASLFGTPVLFPQAVSMSAELAVYGACTGLLYRALPKKKSSVYLALVLSMAAGRLVWGLARYLLAGLSGTEFTASMFLAGAFTTALPGIVLHILLVPPLVFFFEKTGLLLNR